MLQSSCYSRKLFFWGYFFSAYSYRYMHNVSTMLISLFTLSTTPFLVGLCGADMTSFILYLSMISLKLFDINCLPLSDRHISVFILFDPWFLKAFAYGFRVDIVYDLNSVYFEKTPTIEVYRSYLRSPCLRTTFCL